MEDRWPSGIVLWGMVSNHHVLRWLKTVVVSDAEKAQVMRQVGIRKTVRSLELEIAGDVSLNRRDIKTGAYVGCPGISPAGAR